MRAHVGPYQVQGELGRGGMGEVLLAYDPRLDRQVALKQVRADSDDPQGDQKHSERLRREARLAAGLRHPALVQIYDLIEEEGATYIVMEYVAGTTLRQRLREGGPMPLAQGLQLALHLSEGLAYAHHRNVIHRDLKADNVLCGEDGEVKLTDFGIARRIVSQPGDTVTEIGKICGTPSSMAPEVLRGDPPTARSDLFSLGVLLYELFTGISPFRGDTNTATIARVIEGTRQNVVDLRPDLPAPLVDLIEALLEVDPHLRPRDTAEVVVALRALTSGGVESDESTLVAPSATDRSPAPTDAEVGRSWSSSRTDPTAVATETPSKPVSSLAALGILVVLVVLGLALWWMGIFAPKPEPGNVAEPTLHLAVPKPSVSGPETAQTDDLVFALRYEIQRTLRSVPGIAVKAFEEVDAVSGSPADIAQAVDADEVLTTGLYCGEGDCRASLQRIRGSDATVIWSDLVTIPQSERLLAARALEASLLHAFAASRGPAPLALPVTPEDYARFLELSRTLGESQQTDQLEQLLDQAKALRLRAPKFPDAYRLEARLAIRRFAETREAELLDHANRLLDRATLLSPDDISLPLQQVSLELIADRPEAAEAILDRLDQSYPGDVRLLDQRAYLLESRGQLSEALELRQRAAQRSPSWRRLFNLARLLSRLGQISEARHWLEQLLERSPGNRRGLGLLSSLSLQQGDFARAASGYEALLAEQPRVTDRSNLALCYLYLGRLDEADEQLAQAVSSAPQNPFYRLNWADVKILQGDRATATDLYLEVVDLAREDPGAPAWQLLSVRAQALAHLERHSEAVSTAQEVLRRAPEEAWAAFEAAVVYALAGERLTARAEIARAQRLGIEAAWFELPWFEGLTGAAGTNAATDQPPGSSSGGS